MWNRGPIGGPFALVDQTGKPRTDKDFRGKLLLIYFGYSYCPDVCPTHLQQIGLAVEHALRKSYPPCSPAGKNALSAEPRISPPCASARPKRTPSSNGSMTQSRTALPISPTPC